jgi:iron complex outermembrane receptor protein
MNSKISYAVAVILGGASLGASLSAIADEPAADTYRSGYRHARRDHRHRAAPHAEHAGRADLDAGADRTTLQQLNITTFDDYIKELPNVTAASNGPGQNEVFMRGLSAGSQASQGSASTGLWPNVAIYLDNQSAQLPNRNLDIYAADLNRIEVLEGPQGTLFGAGAEAGVIRYITNEPKLDVTEGSVKGGYSWTAHGDPNTDVTAVLNLPLIENTMAVRGVIYDDHRGGYIDNVPATFTRSATDAGISYAGYPAGRRGIPDAGGTTAIACRPAAR